MDGKQLSTFLFSSQKIKEQLLNDPLIHVDVGASG